jgi:type IV secretory pathway TrbD component
MSRVSVRRATSSTAMQTLQAGGAYFLLVFGAGFVLGVIRELWVSPRFGARAAELAEMPVMLGVIVLSACWVIARFGLSPAAPVRIAMGLIAIALLLAAEFSLVIWLRGLTIEEYLAARDPVSGVVYAVMVALYAMMPLMVLRR